MAGRVQLGVLRVVVRGGAAEGRRSIKPGWPIMAWQTDGVQMRAHESVWVCGWGTRGSGLFGYIVHASWRRLACTGGGEVGKAAGRGHQGLALHAGCGKGANGAWA